MPTTNPEVEVIWDGGGWHRSHRRYMRPFVEGAIELASTALEEIAGVEYSHPKRARIRRCGNSSSLAGESDGFDEFALFVPVNDYRRRKASTRFIRYARTSVHELAHTARQERFNTWDLLEEVASEGIAHVVEDLMVVGLDLRDETMYTAAIDRLRPIVPGLKRRLTEDYMQCDSDQTTDQMINDWFEWQNPGAIDDGVVIGIAEVHNRLIEGHSISEIIEWHPEKVLDL